VAGIKGQYTASPKEFPKMPEARSSIVPPLLSIGGDEEELATTQCYLVKDFMWR